MKPVARGKETGTDHFEDGRLLPLVEEFYTIQGEGFHTGKAAYFIRLGGCDIGCSWCDTKFSWDSRLHPLMKADEIVKQALSTGAGSVVVTGGEPLMYNLDYLCRKLKEHNITTYLETSGAYPLSGEWDWICLSPKQYSNPKEDIYKLADELKVIIQTVADFKWAEESARKISGSCKLYLQPEWSQYDKILPRIIDYVKVHPEWNVSLQAHKFMHIP
jgi:organic radical activating enzyme